MFSKARGLVASTLALLTGLLIFWVWAQIAGGYAEAGEQLRGVINGFISFLEGVAGTDLPGGD